MKKILAFCIVTLFVGSGTISILCSADADNVKEKEQQGTDTVAIKDLTQDINQKNTRPRPDNSLPDSYHSPQDIPKHSDNYFVNNVLYPISSFHDSSHHQCYNSFESGKKASCRPDNLPSSFNDSSQYLHSQSFEPDKPLYHSDTDTPPLNYQNPQSRNHQNHFYSFEHDAPSSYSDRIPPNSILSSKNLPKNLTSHEPIYINGNSDFTEANGVTDGNGTESDPYIIENWDINASTATGIKIKNTDVYFIIRNCNIHDGERNYHSGVYFNKVMNGEIENVTSKYNYWGIWLGYSSNNNICSCKIYNNSWVGIELYFSPNNNLRNNVLENNTYNFGVYSGSISDYYQDIDTTNTINGKSIYYAVEQSNLIFDETLSIGYLGLVSCTNIIIKNLNFTQNLQGLLLVDTSFSTISNCYVYNNSWCGGIYLAYSSNNNISGCYIYNNDEGIRFDYSSNSNDISSCYIYNNSYGIKLFYSSNNNGIRGCYICNNYYGIYLFYSSNYNQVTYCDITDNTDYGIYIRMYYYSCKWNSIHHNNFINNTNNAYDECTNYWDNGTEGNYWSDYIGVDENGDGIGDTPYNIDGEANADNYPLIEPVGTDTIKPKITITGVENNTYYNINVTPIITIFDLNLNTTTITLNGVNFTSGTTITEDGTYILFVQATDKMNNPSQETITFTIDKTPPTISLVSPDNNSVIKPGTVINFDVNDDNLWKASYSVNGGETQLFSSPHNLSTAGWSDGTYNITVYAKDWGMNEIFKIFVFTIDGIFPNISLVSPENNSVIKPGRVIDFEIKDVHLNTAIYKMNDNLPQTLSFPYNINTIGWVDGTYNITIWADDLAGNEISKTFRFIVDGTPPNINVTGVINGKCYNTNVTIFINISDARLNASGSIITLDDAFFESGGTVSSEGKHVLYVYGVDSVGNDVSQTISFTIDRTKPEITVTGVVNNVYYNSSVAPVIYVTDLNLDTKSIVLNNETFVSGNIVADEGEYMLFIQAVDKAGNSANKTVSFTIDKTKPVIDITGVEDNAYYSVDVVPVINITDIYLDAGTVILNNEIFVSGTAVVGDGSYTLYVSAVDKAGNTANKTIMFVVDKTSPAINVVGVINGAYYNTANITFTVEILDVNLYKSSAELNEIGFDPAATMMVIAEGRYTLTVSAADRAENTATKTITFTIDRTAPIVTIAEYSRTINEDSFTIHWSTSEEIQYYEISTDSSSWINIGNATSYMFPLSKGGNTLYVRGTDNAGNKGVDMITVTYKEEKPSIIPGFESLTILIVLGACAVLIRRKLLK